MSNIEIRLAKFIVKDHFGDNVAKIVVDLLHKGRKTLKNICHDVNLDKNLVSTHTGPYVASLGTAKLHVTMLDFMYSA